MVCVPRMNLTSCNELRVFTLISSHPVRAHDRGVPLLFDSHGDLAVYVTSFPARR